MSLDNPAEWLAKQFECELCPECGGDAQDHDVIPILGNWFAQCRHPLPDTLDDDGIEAELKRRMDLARDGQPIA
jgi:hypothetical protein